MHHFTISYVKTTDHLRHISQRYVAFVEACHYPFSPVTTMLQANGAQRDHRLYFGLRAIGTTVSWNVAQCFRTRQYFSTTIASQLVVIRSTGNGYFCLSWRHHLLSEVSGEGYTRKNNKKDTWALMTRVYDRIKASVRPGGVAKMWFHLMLFTRLKTLTAQRCFWVCLMKLPTNYSDTITDNKRSK